MHFQDSSLLQFQQRMEGGHHHNNLSTLFDVKVIPKETQMREIIDGKEHKKGERTYSHYVLQGGIAHPDCAQVIPFMPERIHLIT